MKKGITKPVFAEVILSYSSITVENTNISIHLVYPSLIHIRMI